MKKALLIVLCIVLLSGCSLTQLQQDTTTAPIPTNSIPFQMDFKDFKVTLADYSITETLDPIGYTTVLDFKLEFDKSLPEREIRWILKDDLEGYYSAAGNDGKLYLCSAFGARGAIDEKIDPGYTICGNIVYYNAQIQYEGRYSAENAGLKLNFSHSVKGTPVTFLCSSIVTPEKMKKTDDMGKVAIGESAQKYFNDKDSILK